MSVLPTSYTHPLTDRDRHRHSDTDTHIQRETHSQTYIQRERHTVLHTHTPQSNRHILRLILGDIGRQTHIDTHTHTQTHTQIVSQATHIKEDTDKEANTYTREILEISSKLSR